MDLALSSLTDRFAIVTLAMSRKPAWTQLLGWPAAGAAHVPVRARKLSERALLAARIDAAVLGAGKPVLFVAERSGCAAAAWWARLSPADYVRRVSGALFFDPGERAEARFASPRIALPFPSVLVGDGAGSVEGWGSAVIDGDLGPLRRAQRAVERFTAAVVEREVASGRRIWLGLVE